MDYETRLKVQAWLDGEVPKAEASEVAGRVERDSDAAALAEELRNTRRALAGHEAEVRLPESREFYWSKIEREIRRLEKAAPTPVPGAPYLAWLRRLLVPASAVAVVLIAGLVFTRPGGQSARTPLGQIETALSDAGAFTYRDDSAGTTLVWLSYPAENEVAESDEVGTIE